MADPLISESILRELTSAMLMYCLAKPEHHESATSHLKEMVTLANSHGVIGEEETAEFFELDGMNGA